MQCKVASDAEPPTSAGVYRPMNRPTRPMPPRSDPNPTRRRVAMSSVVALVSLALPALASSRRTVAPMTEGPFYPPRA